MDRIDRIPYRPKPQVLRYLENESLTIRGWHFIGADFKLRFSQETVELGKISEATGPISLCNNGMHACRLILDALKFANGPVVCRVKIFGETQEDREKICGRYRQVLAYGDIIWQLHQYGFDLTSSILSGEETDLWELLDVKKKWIERRASSGTLADARQEAKTRLRYKDSIQGRMVAATLEEENVWTCLHQIARAAYGQRLLVLSGEYVSAQSRWQAINKRFEDLIIPKLRFYEGAYGYTNDYFQNDKAASAVHRSHPGFDAVQVERYAQQLSIDSENIRANQLCSSIKRPVYEILIIAPSTVFANPNFPHSHPNYRFTRVSVPSELAKLILKRDFDYLLFDLGTTSLSVEAVYHMIERVKSEMRFKFYVFGDVNEISRNIDFVKQLPKVFPKPLDANFFERLIKHSTDNCYKQ